MPIVDVEVVGGVAPDPRQLADALGTVFGTEPGRTWVRVRLLESFHYAENGVDAAAAPTFTTILQREPPTGEPLAREVAAVTDAVARCVGRPREHVHVTYLPAAAGRQAFGGRLVE